jgi:hypothetical protein
MFEPVPSNDRGIHIQTHRHTGIYEVLYRDGLRYYDIFYISSFIRID